LGRIVAAGFAVAIGAAAPAWGGGRTERVSVSTAGAQANLGGTFPALSPGGRFVAFTSSANNLVPGDTNGRSDVFVRDRRMGTTRRVSLSTGGAQGNAPSFQPAISLGGRFVAFTSSANNLVPGDTTNAEDIFVRDRLAGRTERVSVGPGGAQGNDSSFFPAISADGRFVAFWSYATNLVPGDTNGARDVFVHDRRTRTTERVSVGRNGAQGNDHSAGTPALSADGRFVAFWSGATNLVPGDTNLTGDVFVHDRRTNRTERVSSSTGGAQGNGFSFFDVAISADGRFVAFSSDATNLVPGDTNNATDVFVHDRRTRTTERVSVGRNGAQSNGASEDDVALSAEGRFVAFSSAASNLVPGDTEVVDVFVHDRRTRTTERVNVGPNGAQANSGSSGSSVTGLSADGRFVAFQSVATNLVPGDTNDAFDVFVRRRW
jgi:Tol biopolymer transport system component